MKPAPQPISDKRPHLSREKVQRLADGECPTDVYPFPFDWADLIRRLARQALTARQRQTDSTPAAPEQPPD